MGFGGAVSAMITSLKNNKRNSASVYKKMEGFGGRYTTELHFDKKATPEQLQKIRHRLRKEKQKSLVFTASIFMIIIIVFIYLIW